MFSALLAVVVRVVKKGAEEVVKKAARVVATVVTKGVLALGRFGAKVVKTVSKAFPRVAAKTRAVVDNVSKRIKQVVDEVAPSARGKVDAWIEEADQKTWKQALLDQPSDQRVAMDLSLTVAELAAKLKELLAGTELTGFEAFARVRVATRLLGQIGQKLHVSKRVASLDHLELSVLSTLHALVNNEEVGAEGWMLVDELCRREFGQDIITEAMEQVFVPWTEEATELDRLLEGLAVSLSRLDMERRTLTLREEVEGLDAEAKERLSLSLPAEIRRIQANQTELEARHKDVQLISSTAYGILEVHRGREDDLTLCRDAERAGERIVAYADAEHTTLTEEDRLFFADFALTYRARARRRAKEVTDDVQVEVGVG